jgi:hypothetical protein
MDGFWPNADFSTYPRLNRDRTTNVTPAAIAPALQHSPIERGRQAFAQTHASETGSAQASQRS